MKGIKVFYVIAMTLTDEACITLEIVYTSHTTNL